MQLRIGERCSAPTTLVPGPPPPQLVDKAHDKWVEEEDGEWVLHKLCLWHVQSFGSQGCVRTRTIGWQR